MSQRLFVECNYDNCSDDEHHKACKNHPRYNRYTFWYHIGKWVVAPLIIITLILALIALVVVSVWSIKWVIEQWVA
jgi:uncharacterized membrane protein